MKDSLQLAVPSIAITYVAILLEIVKERGVDPDVLLAAAGLSREVATRRGGYITPLQYKQLAIRAVQMTQDQGIGFEQGLRMRPTSHGELGTLLLSCGTLREAVEMGVGFVRIRQRSLGFSLQTRGPTAILRVQELLPIGWSRHVFIESVISGLATTARYLTGLPLPDLSLHFDIGEPPYFAHYRTRLPTAHFGCQHNEIHFPAHHLDEPLPLTNRIAAMESLQDCQQALTHIGAEDTPDNFAEQVRDVLDKEIARALSLEDVARMLCVSDRTLKRKLQSCGTNFLSLQEDVRHRNALRLMVDMQLKIQEIAQNLGYDDPGNFTRAFRRWTGKSPSAYRRCMGASPDAMSAPKARTGSEAIATPMPSMEEIED